MRTRLSLKPGKKGTKRLTEEYGDRLVCVRYRYDSEKKKRFKTIELIIDEITWQPRPRFLKNSTIVGISVIWGELDLARIIKKAGGKWNKGEKLWELRYDRAIELKLEDRIVREISPKCKL
jgi:hypothetical protein